MKTRTDRPTHRELLALGDISQAYASELASGKKVPSLALAQRIERELGYPAMAWPAEQRQTAA